MFRMFFSNEKKAEMGVGTLIIFIAFLLVAAIAAGVLIQSNGAMQEKALTTGDKTEGEVTNNIDVVEVSAIDGSNGTVITFEYLAKLSLGSDPIKITDSIMTFDCFDKSATLTYAGTNSTLKNDRTGFYTPTQKIPSNHTFTGNNTDYVNLSRDFDDDGIVEALFGGRDGAQVLINLTSIDGTGAAPGGTPSLGNCTNGMHIPNPNILEDSSDYFESDILGCDDDNVTSVYLVPAVPSDEGIGKFAVEYLHKGNNWVNGNFQRGDVIKIYIQAPRNITEGEEIRINFIPKTGNPTTTMFVTPEVMSTQRVYMYPNK